MIYHGDDLGGEHVIEIIIDGKLAFKANGSQRLDVVALRPEMPGIHYRPEPATVTQIIAASVRAPQTAKMRQSSASWRKCGHAIQLDQMPPCPYCQIAKLEAKIEELGEGSRSAAYQKGYVAGRGRYVYLKNKLARLDTALRKIGYGADHPNLKMEIARKALEREKKNRRGGLCDDVDPTENANAQ